MNDQHIGSERTVGGFVVKPWMILTAVVVAVVLVCCTVYGVASWRRHINAKGADWQNTASAKYSGVLTTLSTCLDQSLQAASVANAERESLKDALTSVIAARTSGKAGTGNGVAEAIPTNAQLVISALQEQYPTISPDLYKQATTTIVGCRNEVNGAQHDMQLYAARFKTWTKGAGPFEGSIRENYPNDDLVVDGPNGQLKGMAALNFMATPIITSDAANAGRTKTMPNQQLFPSSSPSPSSTK